MQKTESLHHTLEALKELMSSELNNFNVSDNCEQLTIGKHVVCPNFIMNERHKMARNRSKPLKTKLFPTPAELKFVSAKKAIRDENSKILLQEKEKRFVTRAIIQLEKDFSSRRSSATLSLPELEKRKRIREVGDKKAVKNDDPADFLKSIQKAYESLHRNLSRSHFEKSVPETQQVRRITTPVTPKEKANPNNEIRTETVDKVGKEIRINEKRERTERKLAEIDNCQCRIINEAPKDVIPADNCREKTGNATKQANKLKMLYYWTVWRKVTIRARKENHKLTRIKKIDSFLMRLSKTAEEVQKLEKLANSCQSIKKKEETKPNKRKKTNSESEDIKKLEKELSESAAETYERLNNGLKMFHPKLQPKLKALSILSTVKNKYRSVGTETKRIYPTPAFLTEMENRYKERKTRWENIRKRRSEMEAEKERIMREREEEEKRMEELKKREKLEELKEKRRREKQAEEERKRERRLLKQQLKLAHDHYTRYLLKKVGFQPWQRLIQLRWDQTECADHHSQVRTCRKYLTHWRKLTTLQLDRKYRKAQELYEKILLKKSLQSWMLEHCEYVQKLQVAVDWSDAKLVEKAFVTWFDNAQAQQWYLMRKMEFAESFHDRKIQTKCFKKWLEFPELMRSEKEKEQRKKVWQRKVQEFLPDYQPAFISEI